MRKRGQITIFVIVALVVIVGLILYFFTKGDLLVKQVTPEQIAPEFRPVYSFVQECLKETGKEAIHYIGQTGGYTITPELSYEGEVAYYLYENENHMPTKKDLEEQLSLYVEFAIPFCVNDFGDLSEFNIEDGRIEVKTMIEDEGVVFNAQYPLSVSKGENSQTINNFEAKVSSRLGVMYKAITEIMIEQMEKTDAVCVTCLYEINQRYDLYFHVLDTNEKNTLLFVARDEKIELFEEDYVFYFVNKLEEAG